jgi:hypothetical protein
MFRAMAMKEWREIRGIVLIALAVSAYSVAVQLMPRLPFGNWNEVTVPFVTDVFIGWIWFISIPMTIAIGLRQTLGESIPGTYPFLFHRPAGRRWIIAIKLLVGMSSYLICVALPIAIYGLWAATPGTHAGPFEWPMTAPCWVTWFSLTILYLGAFLTGIRPGRWYATRILPTAGAAFAIFLGFGIAECSSRYLWTVLLCVAADIGFLAAIYNVLLSRDYS